MKPATESDIEDIQQLLHENKLSVSNVSNIISNCMIAYERGKPLAAAGFFSEDIDALIEFVVVCKNHHGEYLGDGIIKALLNLADKKGIKRVYVKGEELYPFFHKVGFEKMDKEAFKGVIPPVISEQLMKAEWVSVAILPDFFMKACRSTKG